MNLDTNIVIAYLDGDENVINALASLRGNKVPLIISAIVESEVLSFSKWNDKERLNTEIFLRENFVFIPFDRTISHISATIRRETGIKFPDAAIAATAIYCNTSLATRNIHDFKKIKNLNLIEI